MNSIYTIGHGNLSLVSFLERLARQNIDVLVDVRSVPFSRFSPQYNRDTLSQSLQQASIRYVFAGNTLGGRPSDPVCYKNGIVPEGKADYLSLVDYEKVAVMPWFLKGLENVRLLSETNQVALLCSEEDPLYCHRHHLIARVLVAHNIQVHHILRTGTLDANQELTAPRQMPLF